MTGTAYYKTPKSDPLQKASSNPGYRIAWKYKKKFERGHLDGEMSYGEALVKAEALNAKEPDKVYWPELLYDTPDGPKA